MRRNVSVFKLSEIDYARPSFIDDVSKDRSMDYFKARVFIRRDDVRRAYRASCVGPCFNTPSCSEVSLSEEMLVPVSSSFLKRVGSSAKTEKRAKQINAFCHAVQSISAQS